MANYGLTPPPENSPEPTPALRELREQGFTVLPPVYSAEKLAALAQKLDAVLLQQETEAGGKAALVAISEANTARALLAYDHTFLALAQEAEVLKLIHAQLGDYVLLHLQNGLINQPTQQHNQHQWHRDLPYQNFISSRPIAISALWCIDEFTATNGATRVVPGSHKVAYAPNESWLEESQHIVTAAAGSVLVFDAMLMHSAGTNTTSKPRRAINHVYTIPLLKQQIDLPQLLGDSFTDNASLRRFLGYDSQTATSVSDFWARKRVRQQQKNSG